MPKLLKRNPTSGNLQEEATIATSGGAGSAGAVPELDGNGKLDQSFMPSGIGADTSVIQASENLAAGDFVNIWNSGGNLRVRKADGGTSPKRADGFVLSAVTSGQNATVYHEGQNNQLSGLTVGSEYFLSDSTAGGVTATPVSGAGKLHQSLGKAVSTTTIATEIQPPIELA